MTGALIYACVGAVLFVCGVAGLILLPHLLRKILAFNIMGSGVFLMLVGLGQHDNVPDPIPQAMVLTGIVVAVAATALALAFVRRLLYLTSKAQLVVSSKSLAQTEEKLITGEGKSEGNREGDSFT
ncbi:MULTISPECIES: NADH-quinone oxidoreductase subunit K [Nitrosomonas]|uniref:Multicomponent Na+:H+ antiporter subunit C n=1 Tax=Nitrosomonas communis TaxID=44574 RepID=A0A5D3Y9Q3_9PROT|nr:MULTISPECIES: NADH-quinone oxidoreductase subunit K [Nitrosomonas]TYP73014.1 multicomponent Na+:H+ antiporter subunit C [Nitrosomonas communis]UVS61802.1 NADH-quinone oxidoreductase subunit K [Nitrosomonas sp. PLL12]